MCQKQIKLNAKEDVQEFVRAAGKCDFDIDVFYNRIIIDAKSGTSGAGRGAKVPNLYCEVNENIKAYGVATHRHTPEIEDQLGYACGQEVLINFTPHLIPMNRGILVTAYASLKTLKKEVSYEEVRAAYDKYYADETFIRVLDKDRLYRI